MNSSRFASTLLLLGLAAVPCAAREGAWTHIGPDGGTVAEIAAAPRSDIVYAGLGLVGVFRSADRGRTWSFAGAKLVGLSIRDLDVDPVNPSLVYASTFEGLFRSTNGGSSWLRIGTAELTGPLGGGVVQMEIHPRRPNTLLAAVFRGALFRSADRGRTWTTEPGWPLDVASLAASTARPGLFWAGLENGGLLKSTDGGRTWTAADRGLPAGAVTGIALDPRTADIVYAAVSGAMFKSRDGGATWKPSGNGLGGARVSDLAVDPAHPTTLYALAGGKLYRSKNGGAVWAELAATGLRDEPQTVKPLAYGVLAGTTAGLFRSTDEGATWRASQTGLAALSIRGFTLDAQDPPRLYAVDLDAGIFKTADGGASWQLLGHPFNAASSTGPVALHPDAPETVYASVPLHVAKSGNGGRLWSLNPVDACLQPYVLLVDPRDPAALYTSGGFLFAGCFSDPNACSIYRSLDAGETWSCIRDGLPGGPGGPLLAINPLTSALYVPFATDVWTSLDHGDTWTLLSPGLLPSSFAASPVEVGTLWVGRVGRVGTSHDGGQTWTYSSTGLRGAGAVMHLAPHPTDPAVIYAGTYDRGVFRSTDGGLTWSPVGIWPAGTRLWAGIALDLRDPSVVYAATDGASVLRYEP